MKITPATKQESFAMIFAITNSTGKISLVGTEVTILKIKKIHDNFAKTSQC